MGVGSYLEQYNKVQILRMNEQTGITKELEFSEPWPTSKILWLPHPKDALDGGRDLLATSSDILRLYFLKQDETDGLYKKEDDCYQLINKSEYC